MVELHSCNANLVNASAALCAIEHDEVKGENSVNLMPEISAELEKEKQKNAQLMERISILEAQIKERDNDPLVSNGQVSCHDSLANKFKRRKLATDNEKFVVEDIRTDSEMKHNVQSMPDKYLYKKDLVVNWMGLNETEIGDSAANFENSDASNDQDGVKDDINGFCTDYKGQGNTNQGVKENLSKQEVEGEADKQKFVSSSSSDREPTSAPLDRDSHESVMEASTCTLGVEIKRCDNNFLQKKPPKIAFCPKEVKRILESGELLLRNAQSHTIRKIIVFASLGIRHGCEDMHELDFSHFSILRKGEPYLSPEDPGEHVLYENPGIRRKIFYPNQQNPTLCPVQILEEEKAMRPSDATCPSCLFLCIKYGGRTRNVPQYEYVRQRMGRNKLKSFGPVICQMAMLLHIRSGSFFFKALGITLLFMAGYPDDLVQKETKCRNLDLLQKYYRTDEDAEGEELFLQPLTTDTNDGRISPPLSMKTISTKLKCKRNTDSNSKGTKDKTSIVQPAPSSSGISSRFALKGFASMQNQAITTAQSITSQPPADLFSLANPLMVSTNPNFPHYDHSSYPLFPPHPANSFVPMMYWHPSTMFLHCPHPSYPIAGNYTSIYPHPYYGTPNQVPKPSKDSWKNHAAYENAKCNSNSSSSSTEPKKDQRS
ncbi:hypothetical protein ACH5RR_017618 [Cinchona calisaya]|uniref:Homer protein n=1 Tax=Cinchona calisaya TaxID=153742 RepID=A0ABD2ZK14_9GENT